MKLHITPGSPNCRKVEATVQHLKLDLEFTVLDLLSGEHKSPKYMELNPNGMLPILEDETFVLWESNAIMQYLACSQEADCSLFPKDPRTRADILRWQFWESAHYGKSVGDLVWETFAKPNLGMGKADETVVNSATKRFHQYAFMLEQQLKDRAFVLGEQVTLADFSLASQAAYIDAADVPYRDYPKIAEWYERLNSIDAWRDTKPQIGIA